MPISIRARAVIVPTPTDPPARARATPETVKAPVTPYRSVAP